MFFLSIACLQMIYSSRMSKSLSELRVNVFFTTSLSLALVRSLVLTRLVTWSRAATDNLPSPRGGWLPDKVDRSLFVGPYQIGIENLDWQTVMLQLFWMLSLLVFTNSQITPETITDQKRSCVKCLSLDHGYVYHVTILKVIAFVFGGHSS